MQTRIVLWGTNASDERVLIALALRAKDNQVDLFTFPDNVLTDEFSKSMMTEWRKGTDIELPTEKTHEVRDLSVAESLLPEDLKITKDTDILQRAQAEWPFAVLSHKLKEAYEAELSEIKDRVDKLENYDKGIWEELKGFWGKVQKQVQDKTLEWNQAKTLRTTTDELFDTMKGLRKKLDQEFEATSTKYWEGFKATLDDVDKKISEGSRLGSVFEELKQIQNKFKKARMTSKHRNELWDRINKAFAEVREKRFGDKGGNNNSGNSPVDRIQRRYDGLMSAMQRMEKSIKYDKDELAFQNKRIATTDGQLEAQIRQAKIKMIQDRITSKEEKYADMTKTKAELEGRIEKIKEKEARRAKEAEAKAAAKAKIMADMKAAEAARAADKEKLEKAAETIKGTAAEADAAADAPKAEEAESTVSEMIDDATTTLTGVFENAVDTVKAVAEVVGEKIEEAVEELKESFEEEE